MNLLDREFLGDFFKTFGFLVLFLCIVYLVKVYLDYFEYIAKSEDNGLYWTFVYYLCRLPEFFVQTGVVSVAAAILWNVTRKARNNEILAWFAGGISPRRLAVPLMAAALIVCAGSFALSEFVVAGAEQRAYYVEKRHIKGKADEDIIQTENIYQRGAEGRLYLIERYDPALNKMIEPTIIQMYKSNRPAWILHAAEAVTEGDKDAVWVFSKAHVRKMSEDGRVESFQMYERVTDQELGMPMEPRLRSFLNSLGDAEQMNIMQLWDYIKLLDAQGKPISEYLLKLHAKLALPFAVLVIALLMCGHVLRPKSQGMIFGFGGGIVWIALYYAAFITCQTLGENLPSIPPFVMIWLPNALFAALGVVLISRVNLPGFNFRKG